MMIFSATGYDAVSLSFPTAIPEDEMHFKLPAELEKISMDCVGLFLLSFCPNVKKN